MPIVFTSKVSPRPRLVRRSVAVIAGIAMAAALSVATLSDSKLARAVGEGVADGFHNMVTVAAMLAERSPGDRPAGALANLKPKRPSILHERALPKVRGQVASPTPYEALVGTPPNPLIAPPPDSRFTEFPLLAGRWLRPGEVGSVVLNLNGQASFLPRTVTVGNRSRRQMMPSSCS